MEIKVTVSKTQASYSFQHIADQYVYSQTFGPSAPSDDKWETTKGDLAFMLDLTRPRTFKHPLLTLTSQQSADIFKYIKGYETVIVIIAPDSIDIEYYTSADAASDAWCELTGICERDSLEDEEDDDQFAYLDEDEDDEAYAENEPILDNEDDIDESESDKNAKS